MPDPRITRPSSSSTGSASWGERSSLSLLGPPLFLRAPAPMPRIACAWPRRKGGSSGWAGGGGAVPFRRCALALLPAASGPPQGCERIAASESEAAALLEATCRSYAFAPSWDPESLAGAVDRLRALGWQGMYGKRAGKRLAVCFGLWDYSAID